MINSTKQINSAVLKTDTLMHVKFEVVRTDTRPISEGINLTCKDPLSDAVALKASKGVLFKVNIYGGNLQVIMPYTDVVKADLFNLDGVKVSSVFNGTMKSGISTIPLYLPQRCVNGVYVIIVNVGGIDTVLKTMIYGDRFVLER
jgi:hypothetical protein